MALTQRTTHQRLEKRLEELALWTARSAIPLDRWSFNGTPISRGEPWPTREGVAALSHGEVSVPAAWPLDDARLDLDLGGEGLVRLCYASGASDAFGLDPNHRSFGLKEPRFAVGRVRRPPALRVPDRTPAAPGTARLARIRLDELALLLRQVVEMAQVLEGHEVIDPLLSAAEESLRELRWPTSAGLCRPDSAGSTAATDLAAAGGNREEPLDSTRRSALRCRQRLRRLRSRLRALRDRYPQTGALALTGHAHLDLAWLWPLAETRRKAIRTFSSVIGLMERHPGFRFNQSTAQLYAFLEADDPALFQQIKQKVASGQWEPSAACGSSPTPTCRPAKPSSASCFMASAISSGPSAAAIRSAGCPTASASRRRCRRSCASPVSTASSPSRSTGPRPTRCPSTSSGGRVSTAAGCAHLQESSRRLQQ